MGGRSRSTRTCRWLVSGTLLAAVAGSPAAEAQSPDVVDAVRDQLRQGLRDVEFAGSFAGLIVLADDLELSGARYAIDDESDTRLSVLALPFRRVLHPWGETRSGVEVEGAVGYGRARQSSDDVFAGALPDLQTAVDADWTTYGALIGVGPSWQAVDGLVLALLGNVGLGRIVSGAEYDGPGAVFTAAVADGIGFNWDAWALSGGAAARGDWLRPLGPRHRLELVARYDVRWTRTLGADDPAQEFTSRLQLLTLRGDLRGPTGLTLFGAPIGWKALAGYRHFFEESLLDVRDLVYLGGALEFDVTASLPLLSMLSINGSVILGGVVTGWSAGVGFAF